MKPAGITIGLVLWLATGGQDALPAAESLPPGFGSGAQPPVADPKSVAKIAIRCAPFHCPSCNKLKTFDWTGFDVDWQIGGADVYPEISWTDKRGVKRVLYGAYTPKQVRWSWEKTQ